MKVCRRYLGACVLLVIGFFNAHACEPSDVEAIEEVFVQVGMWDATMSGFDYVDAAFEALGEELDTRDHLAGATSIFVIFTYQISIFGHTGMNQVRFCLSRNSDQSWEDVAGSLAGNGTEGGSGGGTGGGLGDGGIGYIPEWFDPMQPAPAGCYDIYNCQYQDSESPFGG